MGRSEYELLASALNEAEVPDEYKQILALEIATALCSTGDRFDPARFLKQADIGLTPDQISQYSHALFLRTQTGVGETRNRLHKTP